MYVWLAVRTFVINPVLDGVGYWEDLYFVLLKII